MKKTTIGMLLMACTFFFFRQLATAQDDALAAAVAKLDKASTAKELEQLGNEFARIGNAQPTAWLPFYYAALCNARIGFLYQDDGEKIEPYSNQGEAYAKRAQSLLKADATNREKAEICCLLSMVYRTKVFINPMTYGRQYGPTSQQYLDQALKLDPDNPRALYLQGWTKYYTPKMWGGDKEKAKELLQASLKQLQQQPADGIAPHWGKTESEALLAKYK